MSKTLKTDNLNSRPMARTLVAVSLSLSLAAFGCTTDRTLGNGDPVTTPGLRTSPTGNGSSGSETPSLPPPMFSSSIDNGQALPAVKAKSTRLTAEQAAAVMADQQPRVRYLGVTMPGNSGRPYVSDGIQLFQNPALRTNPQQTVNSSISSQPTPVVASGAGGSVGGDAITGGAFVTGTSAAATTGASVATGVTAASTATGTGLGLGVGGNVGSVGNGAAPIFASPAIAGSVTPSSLPLGTLAATATPTTAPTAFSALNPPTAISGFPALAANSTVTQSAVATNTNTANGVTLSNGTAFTGTDAMANTTTSRTRSGLGSAGATSALRSTAVTSSTTATTTAAVSNPVRLARDANGRVVITNTPRNR